MALTSLEAGAQGRWAPPARSNQGPLWVELVPDDARGPCWWRRLPAVAHGTCGAGSVGRSWEQGRRLLLCASPAAPNATSSQFSTSEQLTDAGSVSQSPLVASDSSSQAGIGTKGKLLVWIAENFRSGLYFMYPVSSGSRSSEGITRGRPVSASGLGWPLGWLYSQALCLVGTWM